MIGSGTVCAAGGQQRPAAAAIVGAQELGRVVERGLGGQINGIRPIDRQRGDAGVVDRVGQKERIAEITRSRLRRQRIDHQRRQSDREVGRLRLAHRPADGVR